MMFDRQSKKSLATLLRHRVLIRTKVETPDTQGGFTMVWSTTTTVWAPVDPIKAIQTMDYRAANVDATHTIKMRGNVSVVETQRLQFDSRDFEILTIENIQERDVFKVITCKEIKRL